MKITINQSEHEVTESQLQMIERIINRKKVSILSIDDVYLAVSDYTGIADFSVKNRKTPLCYARHLFCYLCRKVTRASFKEIGQMIGGRDHTTAINSENTMKDLCDTDENAVHDVEYLLAVLLSSGKVIEKKPPVAKTTPPVRIEVKKVPMVRPPSIYSNNTPYGIAKGTNG
jgi:hypothetical protein